MSTLTYFWYLTPAASQDRPSAGINNVWYNPNESDTVFVFVHGLLSDSRDAWFFQSEADPALDQYWPELIRTDPKFDNPAIFLGGFHTSVASGPYDMRDAANELFNSLFVSVDPANDAVLDRPEIIFITHSTGGIVVRHMLVHHRDKFANKKVGLILIASPSFGSRDADQLDFIANIAKNKLGKQLKWNNPFLEELDKDFKNLVNDRVIPGMVGTEWIEHHLIGGQVGKSFGILRGRPLVEEASASRYFGEPIRLPGTDHFSAVKPNTRNHPTYRRLRQFYEDKFLNKEEPPSKVPNVFRDNIDKKDQEKSSFYIFENLGQELADDLQSRKWSKMNGIRIALWPLDPKQMLLTPQQATYYDSALANVLANRLESNKFSLLSGHRLDEIRAQIRRKSTFDQDITNPIAAFASFQDPSADIVIIGRPSQASVNRLSLAYQAISVADGTIVAQAYTEDLPMTAMARLDEVRLQTLDAAIDEAVSWASNNMQGIKTLNLCGIRYRDTGVEPEFGHWIRGHISDRLLAKNKNTQYKKKIDPNISDNCIDIDKPIKEESIFSLVDEKYEEEFNAIQGEYWDFDDFIEIRLKLRSKYEQKTSWIGRIIYGELGSLAIKPTGENEQLAHSNPFGPINFILSSNRGDDPIYKIGEYANLVIKLSDDAFVHCFHRTDAGETVKIFPNEYHPSGFVRGMERHIVPGELMPFDLAITLPTGIDLIKCFATPTDETERLPLELQGISGERLSFHFASSFVDEFRAAVPSHLSEASLLITVQDNAN